MKESPGIKARLSYVEATEENMSFCDEDEEQVKQRASGLGALFKGRSLWTFWKMNPSPAKSGKLEHSPPAKSGKFKHYPLLSCKTPEYLSLPKIVMYDCLCVFE
jgi:hypothetical protein